jgi:hypothetical protein
MGKKGITVSPSAPRVEKTLSGACFLLRRFPLCHSALEDRTVETRRWCGFANLKFQHSVSPVHPRAPIESALQLHAGAAHGRLNLLPRHPVDHAIAAQRVILAHRTALPNAQHGIQIGFWQHRTVGIARQLRLVTTIWVSCCSGASR